MGKINLLSEETVNQIAAGEVIERPLSVIKELIENSMDAGASKIDITLSEGGKHRITVEDNGSGMDEDDAKKCILKHATSKIKDHHDLFKIMTLGFRGEALSSVAAISKLTIITRTADAESGLKLYIENGEIVYEEQTAANIGTKIIVEDIFYNVPARMKFLKSNTYEQKLISDIVMRYALIHSEIAYSLRTEDGVQINKPNTKSIKENIASIYGFDVAKETFEIKSEQVKGTIVKPTINRATKDYMSIYVNERFVKSQIIENALMDALDTLLFHGRYPIAVLDITLDPTKIDVNVHPTKKVIKFDDEKEIYDIVYDAVKKAISYSDLFTNKEEETHEKETQSIFKDQSKDQYSEIEDDLKKTFTHKEKVTKEDDFILQNIQEPSAEEVESMKIPEDLSEKNKTEGNDSDKYSILQTKGTEEIIAQAKKEHNKKDEHGKYFEAQTDKQEVLIKESEVEYSADSQVQNVNEDINIIGIIHKTYIIMETKDGYGLVDLHAAHERVMFEKIKKQFEDGNIAIQELLTGHSIDLNPKEFLSIKDNMTLLNDYGFEVEEFGQNSVIVRTIPADHDTKRFDLKETIITMAEKLSEKRKINTNEKQEDMIKYMACRSAIKAGVTLNTKQMKELVIELMKTDRKYTCPHGRPTIVNYTIRQIEKEFKRIE